MDDMIDYLHLLHADVCASWSLSATRGHQRVLVDCLVYEFDVNISGAMAKGEPIPCHRLPDGQLDP